jgi:hypothetical protein
MIKLQVYTSADCWTCAETERIVLEIANRFPDVEVNVLDLMSPEKPDEVFAVPTYLINGRIVSLGNPTRKELAQKLMNAQNGATR